MHDAIRGTLRELIAQQGSSLYRDPRRLEAMLRDVAGEQPAEIFVLTTAARAGVIDELIAASPGLEAVAAERATDRLASEFGLDHEVSGWAVDSWADALGVRVARGRSIPAGSAVQVEDDATRTVYGTASGPSAAVPIGASSGGWPAAASSGSPVVSSGPPSVAGSYGTPPTSYGGPAMPSSPYPPAPPASPASAAGPPPLDSGGRRPSGRWRRRLIPLLALAVFASGLTAIVVALNQSPAAGGEIFAEPTLATGANPFTSPVNVPLGAATPHLTLPQLTTPTTVARSTPSVGAVSGAAPGLYGGTGSQSTCNAGLMVQFLQNHPSMAAAWAGVEGISTAQLAAYVASLTPVLLRADTRVTNHGFSNGRATTLQSVLQAGTAVLVDHFGVPRTRCACGNPLTVPVATRSQPRYKGSPWPGLSPASTVVVSPSPTIINNFTVVNVYNGTTYQQPTGVSGLSPTTTPPLTAPATTAPASVAPTTAPPATQPTGSACIVPPSSVLGWWTGDDTAADRSSNHLDAALEGGATYGPGKVGEAFQLNGSAWVEAPASPVWDLGSNDFTIDLWVNFVAPPGGEAGGPGAVLVGADEGGGNMNKWWLAAYSGNLGFHINGPSVGAIFLTVPGFTPTAGQWYHVAVTRQGGSNYTFYVNGAAIGDAVNSAVIPAPAAPLTMGEGEGLGYVKGSLDEVQVVGRALSSSQIAAIYNAGAAGQCAS